MVSFLLNLIISIVILVAAVGGFQIWKYRRKIKFLRSVYIDLLMSNEEMQRTMAMGLYHRFKRRDENEPTGSDFFLRDDPLIFEAFVAKVMEKYYGGSCYVTSASGDFGVDIEHTRKDGLYLGQVKCEYNDQPYRPIALIHSQMVKQGAKGGFVVSVSDFSEKANHYTQELKQQGYNIELIDGKTLVRYWALGMADQVTTFNTEQESFI